MSILSSPGLASLVFKKNKKSDKELNKGAAQEFFIVSAIFSAAILIPLLKILVESLINYFV